MLTFARRALEVVLLAYVVGVVGLALAARAAPIAGWGMYAVRSASMAPALAKGDLVIVDPVAAGEVRPGDVVTMAVRPGTTVTHRVVSVVPNDDGPLFTTKGDANATADPVAVRADQLQGRADMRVPLLGFLLAMLAMPSGVIALLSIGASLATAIWLLDDLEADDLEAYDEGDDETEKLHRQLGANTSATPTVS
jgi:signal peptidase I